MAASDLIIALHGIGASQGIAIGKVYVVERGHIEVHEKRLPKSRIDAEVKRFDKALATARAELESVKERIPDDAGAEIASFIDTHLLMMDDVALSVEPMRHIREQRCNAEWALKQQRDALVSVFDSMEDAYLRTRKDDVVHVVDRIQEALVSARKRRSRAMPVKGRIVFADDLTPADTVLMQHQGVTAMITEFGGPTSHTAILARSLRIPAVVGLHEARLYLRNDEVVIVDGREGVVIVNPAQDVIRYYRGLIKRHQRMDAKRRKLKKAPAVSADGEAIGLQANVELTSDVDLVQDVRAAGVGLYRTEFLFMNREQPPDEEEQFVAYSQVAASVPGAPVTIRTLDLGADKQVDGGRPGAPISTNPALGLRAVRLCLKEPGLFKPQIRAILRVSASAAVRMMIPMLSTMHELVQVKQIVEDVKRELVLEGVAFDARMPIGAMIEVPAAAICAELFARQLDFLSIGTNDLIQYTIAIDRVDDEVNYLYDPLHPAVLRLIQYTIRAGQKAGIPVAMCGEMAGDSRYTRLLLGLGLKEFSVHPNSLLEVKHVIKESHVGDLRKLATRFMRTAKTPARERLMLEMNQNLDL
ncbi:MAG: phosphotransferase system enzyme I (PtsI) [Gammaproteobacteria bacterium]|jgi:phosphotransferase system enzyme I (PtsI)